MFCVLIHASLPLDAMPCLRPHALDTHSLLFLMPETLRCGEGVGGLAAVLATLATVGAAFAPFLGDETTAEGCETVW